MSPGKAAATAATAAAKEAAKAAAASVKAAEAAADAAEAAEAAAEAEEEMQLSQPQSRSEGLPRSPFANPDLEEKQEERGHRRQCSPARSAFYLTERGREEEAGCLEASRTPKSRHDNTSPVRAAGGEGVSERGDENREGYTEAGEGRNHHQGEAGGSAGSEEQMLRRARDQVNIFFCIHIQWTKG